jgi:proton-translocating NADH-quinone oxidoreductase chain N
MNPSNAITWLIAIPLFSSPIIYLLGRIFMRAAKSDQTFRPAKLLAVFALLATAYPLYIAGDAYLTGGTYQIQFNSIVLQMDGIALILAGIVLGLGLMATIFSATYMKGDIGEEKFFALLTALIGSIIGLGLSYDLFNLWVWFEAMTITGYTLVAFYQDQKGSLEAGVKYLVQSAAGSVLVLLGIVLVFLETSTVNISEIGAAVSGPSIPLLVAGALFIIGFGVKTALVPLHTWLPDAHSQAPSGISAMLSGVVIEAGLICILRSVGAISAASDQWGIILLVMGALNIALGNMMALRQTEVKRLLAYSSIGHLGYMLVGFGAALSFGVIDGAAGGFFHMTTHALMKGLAFFSAGALLYTLHLANGNHVPLILDDLNGVSKRYPILALCFSIALLALGGLPPLAGFMSKWQIFVAGFQTQDVWVQVLVVFAALNSVLSLGYYAPMVNRMYRKEPSAIVATGKPISFSLSFPIILLTLLVIVIGFWPTLFSWITNPAAESLLTAFGI